jgi:hypothetical protein
MALDVFVSYSHKDKTTADAVCAGIESAGIRCWIAPRDIEAGTEWAEGIIIGINRCRLMVLIFSENANQSSQVRREIERAVNRELPILPFRIENVGPSSKLEYFLGNLHWLDALTPPLAAHIERFVETIKSLQSPALARDIASTRAKPERRRSAVGGWREQKGVVAGGVGALAVIAGMLVWTIAGKQPPSAERDGQVIALAEQIRTDINNGAFDKADKTLDSLARLSASSGHTLYFEGELQRIMRPNRDLYRAIDWFIRYEDDPRNAQVLASDRLDAQFCYESAEGFCRQRTGWIAHLIANILYRWSIDQTLEAEKRETFLRRADQYVQMSVKFYPIGFPATVAAPTQTVDNAWSTTQLVALIKQRLH